MLPDPQGSDEAHDFYHVLQRRTDPLVFRYQEYRLYNTIWVSSIPYAVSAYNMIIMKTFFESIPESLEEAAIIDGANDFTVFSRIIMPLSKPVVAVMILYYA